jgi:hypothetical protein
VREHGRWESEIRRVSGADTCGRSARRSAGGGWHGALAGDRSGRAGGRRTAGRNGGEKRGAGCGSRVLAGAERVTGVDGGSDGEGGRLIDMVAGRGRLGWRGGGCGCVGRARSGGGKTMRVRECWRGGKTGGPEVERPLARCAATGTVARRHGWSDGCDVGMEVGCGVGRGGDGRDAGAGGKVRAEGLWSCGWGGRYLSPRCYKSLPIII